MARKKVEKGIAFDDTKKLYYVTMDYGKDETGKRVKTTKTFADLKEARKELKIFLGDKEKGTMVAPKNDTLRTYSQYWLDVEKKDCRETTLYGYRNILNNHVLLYMGDKELQKIKRQDIFKYFSHLETKGLSANSIRKHYDLLKNVFLSAQYAEKVYKSPVATIKPLKTTDAETSAYTAEQVVTLFKALNGDRLEIAVRLAVMLGLRRGEICGLHWGNVSLDKGLITIIESRTQVGNKFIEGDVKSQSSERVLTIPKGLLPVLQRVKEQQEKDKAEFGDYYKDDGYVMAWPDGRPYRPNYVSDLFKDFLEKQGLPHVRFHDLRHTFGSLAVTTARLRDVSKAMGHVREDFTDKKYIHEYADAYSEAVNAVDSILAEAESK